ncbi:MAG: RNA 2',3'-cyclic phosphodiesterase, partial [Desulfurivibrionaceae bacterium]|nr:RNA 2',3'-cyclic phosphodiesterase [Desulfurivibrionaceae bacterium]
EALFRQISNTLAAIETEPLTLQIRGLGQFPPHRAPRILWLGLAENDRLVQLRNRIETALLRSGLAPEGRGFSPHLTFARFKKMPPRQLLIDFIAANSRFELPPFPVGAFHLYSSKITADGAIHQREASYPIPLAENAGTQPV